MKQFRRKEINVYELLSNMYIALVASLGGVRGLEWIVTSKQSLNRVSPLYAAIEKYSDVHLFGWLMLISAILLFLGIFFKGKCVYILFIVGGSIGATVHFLFAMTSVETANLFTTYYNALIVACSQWILVAVGVVGLWKMNDTKR